MGIVIRQSLKGTFVNYVGVALGIFVQFVIVTRYLTPEVIGLTGVIYQAALMCSGLALLGSPTSAMRFFPLFSNKENGNNGFLFYFLLLPIVGTILVGIIYCLCRPWITDFFGGSHSDAFNDYFYWVLPLMVILTFWSFFETYSNINMRIAVPKAVREVGMRLLLLACYLLYAFGYVGVSGFLVCCFVSYGLCMLTTGIYSLHIGSASLRHDWSFITPSFKRQFSRYTGFLMLAAISGNVMGAIDLFMLGSLKGLYDAGVYSIVIYMAAVVEMPSRSISAIATPQAASALKNGDFVEANQLYKQVSIHQMIASTVLLLIVWVNLDSIFAILPNGEKFVAGRYAVLFLGLAKVLYSTLNFGNILIQFSKYYYWTLFIAIFLTALTITTNWFCIPLWGLTGAAFATFITSVVNYSYQQYLVQRKVHGNPFTWGHLRMVAVVAVLYGINFLIPDLTTGSCRDLFPADWNVLVYCTDILYRTVILSLLATVLVYACHISKQVNGIIDYYILRRETKQ